MTKKPAGLKDFAMSEETNPYFSDSYEQARAQFKKAALARTDCTFSTYEHPSEIDDNGAPLSTDVAWLGPKDAKKILVLSSALHGAEGPVGSAIQLQALTEQLDESLADDTAIVFIHAINPYGFKYMKRGNEDNIDLNRNFLDWLKDLPKEHFLTHRVQSLLAVDHWNWPKTLFKGASILLRHGMRALQASLQQGQYSRPDGLFYGGDKPAWSNEVMRSIAKECTEHAEKIIHVDIHSGLGKRGEGVLLVSAPSQSEIGQRAKKIWGEISSTVDGKSVSAHVSGSIDQVFNDAAAGKNCEINVAALEFGTLSPFSVLKALAYDNWVSRKGLKGEFQAKARAYMSDAFSPNDPVWQIKTLAKGSKVFSDSLQSLKL